MQCLILLDNQHKALDCSFVVDAYHSSCTSLSSLGIFRYQWKIPVTTGDKGRQTLPSSQLFSREFSSSPFTKIFFTPQLWMFRNLYPLTTYGTINIFNLFFGFKHKKNIFFFHSGVLLTRTVLREALYFRIIYLTLEWKSISILSNTKSS